MDNCHTSESPHTIRNHSNNWMLITPYCRNWLVSYSRVTAWCELDEGLGSERVEGSSAFLSITSRANLLFLSRTDSVTSIPLICMASAPQSLKKNHIAEWNSIQIRHRESGRRSYKSLWHPPWRDLRYNQTSVSCILLKRTYLLRANVVTKNRSLRRWNHQDRVAESFHKSLKTLGTGYIDLVCSIGHI